MTRQEEIYCYAKMLNGDTRKIVLCPKCGESYESSTTGNVVTQCPGTKCSRWGPLRVFTTGDGQVILGKCKPCGTWVEPCDSFIHSERCNRWDQ